MTFYALPKNFSSHSAKNFLKFYAKYPENYLPLIKYAHFFLKDSKEELENAKYKLIENTTRDLENYFKKTNKSEGLSPTKSYENEPVKITANEKAYKKAMSLGCEPIQLKEEDGVSTIKSEDIDKFIGNFRPDFFKYDPIRVRTAASEILSTNKLASMLSDECFDTKAMIVNRFANIGYEDDELICQALLDATPREQDIDSVIEWLECQMRKGISLSFPMFAIESIVMNAEKHNKDEFLCFLFNEYSRFSHENMTPLLMGSIIKIVSKSNCEGEYVEAVAKIVNKFNEIYKKGTELDLDIFTLEDVRDAVLECYLKDKKPSDGALVSDI